MWSTSSHIERNRSPVESASKDPIATGDHASKEIHKIMAYALTQARLSVQARLPVVYKFRDSTLKLTFNYSRPIHKTLFQSTILTSLLKVQTSSGLI